jgi:DNA-binding response OmpR family regulator
MDQQQLPPPARASTEETTILVVEDDHEIGRLLVQVLTNETSYQALLALDASQALETVKTQTPHLFILDYLLPGMNGIALYDQLHSMNTLSNVPALIMSASLPWREIQQRHLAYLSKPFELDELLQRVEELLS